MSIAIIGGSGFYKLFEEATAEKVKTPFGYAKVYTGTIAGTKVHFLTRHGISHSIPPHLVNYRANIFALHKLGVKQILTSSAVGSLLQKVKPGDFVVPDQFIDFTIGRPKTFFDGSFETTIHSGEKRSGVVHIDVSEPYCPELRSALCEGIQSANQSCAKTGVYVCTEGPRFETPAEINAFKVLGGTLVGMTSVSECVLAQELGICYATICLVTNFAAGMQAKISAEEVFSLFKKKIPTIKEILRDTIVTVLEKKSWECTCASLL